jgi:hypothetical protein
MAVPAIKHPDNPLEGVRWDAAWETGAAAELFAAVRELCGVRVGEPELTTEMVATALQEACEILDRNGELEEPIAVETDAAEEHGAEEEAAADGWSSPGWRDAAAEYHRQRGGHVLEVEIEPERARRLRRLLDDGISFERAHAEISSGHVKGRAADLALMHSLRERGVQALDEPNTRRRFSQLSDDQLLEVAGRLQRLKPEIARAWSAEEIEALVELRETLHALR